VLEKIKIAFQFLIVDGDNSYCCKNIFKN